MKRLLAGGLLACALIARAEDATSLPSPSPTPGPATTVPVSAATAPPPGPAPAVAPPPSPAPVPPPAPPVASPRTPPPKAAAPVKAAAHKASAPQPAPAVARPPAAPEPVRVGDALIKFGQDIVLTEGQAVGGPVLAIGGSIYANGAVDGPVLSVGGSAHLGPKADVNGPVLAIGGATLLDDGARVNGPVLQLPGARAFFHLAAPLLTAASALAALAAFGKLLAGVGWLVVGLVLWTLFPDALRNTRDTLDRSTAVCAVWGVLAWPALGVISLTFLVSLVGLPLLPLVALLAALAYVWGTVSVAFWIGSRAGEGRWESSLGSILVGILLLKLIGLMPVVRWVIWAAVTVLGAGAALASRFGLRQPEHVAPVVK